MKLLPVILAGLVAGAVLGLVAALLRPRRRSTGVGYRPDVELDLTARGDADASAVHPPARRVGPTLDARHD